MPWIFYAIGAVLPATYFISLMRAIILRGASFLEYWPSLAIMTGMASALVLRLRVAFPEEDRLTRRPSRPRRSPNWPCIRCATDARIVALSSACLPC